MSSGFVHLHVHSEYSIEDGLVRLTPLIDKIVADQSPAVALTEQSNLFSALKFYCAAQKVGIKPIIGVEIRLKEDNPHQSSSRLVLLCQNYQGYRNLNSLISKSYLEGQQYKTAFVEKEWVADYADGLIALSGAQYGDIGQALRVGNDSHAKQRLDAWQSIFPDRFYIELQRTHHLEENDYIDSAVSLAIQANVPVVATNNVRFLSAEDYDAHDARVCVQQSCTLTDYKARPFVYTDKQYLRSSAEMIELFSDLPEAIENTWEIAKRCNLELVLGENYLPNFPVPENFDQNTWLIQQAKEGLTERLVTIADVVVDVDQEPYWKRLEAELDVIKEMGFSGYFLIVADFIQWAKDNNIPVGPGRGSGSGSLVAYALDITAMDPIQYDLLFERFLNPERISLPDFDIDFCVERRDEVIDYVSHKYGKDKVSQIITYGHMSARAVIRDIGRVLNHPYGYVDQISKLVPMDVGISLDRALKEEERLKERYENDADVRNLIDLARPLEGIARHASRHAGGIVISPKPLIDYMPLYYEQGSDKPVSQFDMNDVEAIGLVKFDFLGLRTLTIIQATVDSVNAFRQQQGQSTIAINDIPLDDKQSYALICRNETNAIFQLESDGMKKIIKRLQPNTFDDLIALVALFRPGPLQSGMVDDYIDCKHGKAKIKYAHPMLEPILSSTNGVILYQEQVMKIAQVLAGYTLGAADVLRRAMGKKKPEEMVKQRVKFTNGAVNNGVDLLIAKGIFDLMEKFAGYGFNKSHSATYALIAYQTAWLKTHFPVYFMSAVFSSEMYNTDKIVMLADEVKSMEIKLIPPSVNHSHHKFIVEDANAIRFGLGAIKGASESSISGIINARDKGGCFVDIFDLCRRVDMQKINKRILESMVYSGAADELGPSRSRIFASLNKATHLAEQSSSNSNSGQNDLFGLFSTNDDGDKREHTFLEAAEWPENDRLMGEKDTLGFYLQGHPIIRYETELSSIISMQLRDMKIAINVCVAGYIHSMRTRFHANGRLAEVVLDDGTARAHVKVFSRVFKQSSDSLIKDTLIIINGEIVSDDFLPNGMAIVANQVYTLVQCRSHARLHLKLSSGDDLNTSIHYLTEIFLPRCGGSSPVVVEYNNDKGRVTLLCSDEWKITIDDTLLDYLRNYFGDDNIWLDYANLRRVGNVVA